jgi:hypothetical protein
VTDVEGSSRWHQRLLDCESAHGGPEYEPTDDFDGAVARANELGAEIVKAPHRNPPAEGPCGPAHREIWLRDLDGYTVVLASPDGEAD